MKSIVTALITIGLVAGTACADDPSKSKPEGEVGQKTERNVNASPAAKALAAMENKKAGQFVSKTIKLKGDIGFVGSKVTGSHTGTFKTWQGVLVTAPTLEGASFAFSVDVDSVVSDPEDRKPWSGKLDGHLKSEDFFYAEKHPKATFESTKLVAHAADGHTHKITGKLTMRGVTRSVTFPATVRMNGDQFEASSEFSINRSDWGIEYKGKADDLIREKVVLKIQLKS